jgi:hypothetical protein
MSIREKKKTKKKIILAIIFIPITFIERNVLENMARPQGCHDILRSIAVLLRLQLSGL